MPLLPITLDLPPLVARRLPPPAEAPLSSVPGIRTFWWEPVETPTGVLWTYPEGTSTDKGLLRFKVPGVFVSVVRRWWVGSDQGLVTLDPSTGATRTFPYMSYLPSDQSLDEEGVPLGFLHEGFYDDDWRPARGGKRLTVPPDHSRFGGILSQLIAAPKGRAVAGVLPVGPGELPEYRPFLWRNDDAPPRALPWPEGADRVVLGALNSRGDLAATVGGPDFPTRFLIWRSEGGTEEIPLVPDPAVGKDHRAGKPIESERRTPRLRSWMPQDVIALTDDGTAIAGQLGVRLGSSLSLMTIFWDGRRSRWIGDAIDGVRPQRIVDVRLAEDGRSFLMRILHEGTWDWYFVSPRSPAPQDRAGEDGRVEHPRSL